MSINWVMLDNEGKPVCLPQEQFVLELGGRIACEIKPTERRRWPEPLPNKSASGKLYLSNKRIIYLPTEKTSAFRDVMIPIKNASESACNSSGFLGMGPWYWRATINPVPGGNIPACYPLVEMELTFHDGGVDHWRNAFLRAKEEALQGGEALPQYQERAPASPNLTSPASPTNTSAIQQPGPSEAPPNYEESQAQALSRELDSQLRGDASRESS